MIYGIFDSRERAVEIARKLIADGKEELLYVAPLDYGRIGRQEYRVKTKNEFLVSPDEMPEVIKICKPETKVKYIGKKKRKQKTVSV
jgi:hypothetical protein